MFNSRGKEHCFRVTCNCGVKNASTRVKTQAACEKKTQAACEKKHNARAIKQKNPERDKKTQAGVRINNNRAVVLNILRLHKAFVFSKRIYPKQSS